MRERMGSDGCRYTGPSLKIDEKESAKPNLLQAPSYLMGAQGAHGAHGAQEPMGPIGPMGTMGPVAIYLKRLPTSCNTVSLDFWGPGWLLIYFKRLLTSSGHLLSSSDG